MLSYRVSIDGQSEVRLRLWIVGPYAAVLFPLHVVIVSVPYFGSFILFPVVLVSYPMQLVSRGFFSLSMFRVIATV